MDFETWKLRIQESAEKIADEDYQKSTWLGQSEKISSPEELYCTLFEDFLFEDFLENSSDCLNEEEIIAGKKLSRKMSAFFEKSDSFYDPVKVLESEEWQKIRETSRCFLTLLKG